MKLVLQLRSSRWWVGRGRAVPASHTALWGPWVLALALAAQPELASADAGWTGISPPGLYQVGDVVADPHVEGRALLFASEPSSAFYWTGVLFESLDRGATWQPAGAGLPRWGPLAGLRFDPHQPGHVYACATSGGVAGVDALYRSTDGGLTWTGFGFDGAACRQLEVDPVRSGTLVVVLDLDAAFPIQYVARRSTDGGATWSPLTFPPAVMNLGPVHLASDGPGSMYAAAANGGSLFRSTDGGATWSSNLQTALVQSDPSFVATSPAGDVLFLGWRNWFVLRSANGGASWSHVETQDKIQGWLTFDPVIGDRVWAVGTFGSLLRSEDGGESFSSLVVMDELAPGHRGLALLDDAATVLLGTPVEGLWRSTDGAVTWEKADGGVDYAAHLASVLVDPDNECTVVVAQDGLDRGGVYRTNDGGRAWQRMDGIDGPTGHWELSMLRWAADGDVVATIETCLGCDVRDWRYSTLDDRWAPIEAAAAPGLPCDGVSFHPTQPEVGLARCAVGGDPSPPPELRLTEDGGESWSVVAVNPPTWYAHWVDGSTTTAVGPGFPPRRTTDGGASWTPVTGLPGLWEGIPHIGDLVVDAAIPGRLYAIDNYSAEQAFYRSSDAGATWTQVAWADWLPWDLQTVARHPLRGGHLVLGRGTDFSTPTYPGGVHESFDGGTSWQPLGLQGLSVQALAMGPALDGPIFAVTDRGLFRHGVDRCGPLFVDGFEGGDTSAWSGP